MEVRKLETQMGYRISNGEQFLVISHHMLDKHGHKEYAKDPADIPFELIHSMEALAKGQTFDCVSEIKDPPYGTIAVTEFSVLFKTYDHWKDMETGETDVMGEPVVIHRVGE